METSTKYNRYAARVPKGMWVGVAWLPKCGGPGTGGSCPIQTHSDRQKKGVQQGGCKNWTFFMDAINELCRADFENCSSFFQIPAKNIKVRNFL